MKNKFLLSSMAELSAITFPLLEITNAKSIVEVGADHQGNSKALYLWLMNRDGKLFSIDPMPPSGFFDWLPQVSDVVNHSKEYALDVISNLENIDAWFISADQNWYTVYHQLLAIHQQSVKSGLYPLVFIQGIGWPSGRRDLYASTERIPAEYLQPHSWTMGLELDNPNTVTGGYRGNGSFAVACKEGGEFNGVLTAIEDFVGLYPGQFHWASIPVIFGMGILFPCKHPKVLEIANFLEPYHDNALLANLERNRLENMLKLLEYKDAELHSQPKAQPELKKYEEIVMMLIDILDDNQDHPEIWDIILHNGKKSGLAELIACTDQLLRLKQSGKIEKILKVIRAVAMFYGVDPLLATREIELLATQFPSCHLINGAFHHIHKSLSNIV